MSEKPVLLAVDDEELILDLLVDILEGEFTLLTTTNVESALRILQSSAAIVGLITDLHIPDLNGRELIRQVRRHYPRLPILALSGTYPSSQEDATLNGDAFLAKPFEVDEIRAVAHRLFGGVPANR